MPLRSSPLCSAGVIGQAIILDIKTFYRHFTARSWRRSHPVIERVELPPDLSTHGAEQAILLVGAFHHLVNAAETVSEKMNDT